MGMAEVEVRMGSSRARGSPGDGRDGSEAETS